MEDEKLDRIFLVAIGIVALLGIAGNFYNKAQIQQLKELYVPTVSEEEKYFDQLTEDIIQCESQGKMVWGDLDKPHKSFGVAQFQFRTFQWLSDLYGKKLNYNSSQDQRELLRWAVENGHARLWTCYSIVKGF